MSNLTPVAQKLRNNPTDAEKKLWQHLRLKQFMGLKFRRQQIIERYIVDFLCFEKRLIVEVDGGQHNENKEDEERTKFLETKGFLVLRFWNNEVLNNIEGVLTSIENTLNSVHPHPNPPPEGEGIRGKAGL